MNETEFQTLLADLGLTPDQIEVYLAILEAGKTTVAGVVETTDVSESGVYRMVDSLVEKDLIDVNRFATPTELTAKTPKVVFNSRRARLDSLRSGIEERSGSWSDFGPGEHFSALETGLERFRSLVAGAERELLVCLPAQLLPRLRDRLHEALDRGIMIQLVIEGQREAKASVEPPATILRRGDTPKHLRLIVDRSRALSIDEKLIEDGHNRAGGYLITRGNLVYDIFRIWQLKDWQKATETYRADPVGLPWRTNWFHHGVVQATIHRQAGTDLIASVPARSLAQQGEHQLEGPIKKTKQFQVHPTTNERPMQSAMIIETSHGTVDVGGPEGTNHQYAATGPVTLKKSINITSK